MPFEPAVRFANQPHRLVRPTLKTVEQETRRAQVESLAPEPLRHSGALGHSAEHRVLTVRLPSSCPFPHRACQPYQQTFPQSVAHRALPEAGRRRLTAPVGKRQFPTAQSRQPVICGRLSFAEMIVATCLKSYLAGSIFAPTKAYWRAPHLREIS